jgi:hypothetical protein
MRAEWVDDARVNERSTACVTLPDMLRANVGKPVRIEYFQDKDGPRVIEGTIEQLLETPADEPERAPWAVGGGDQPGAASGPEQGIYYFRNNSWQPETVQPNLAMREARVPLSPAGGQYVVISAGGRRVLIPVSAIQTIAGDTLATTTSTREKIFRRDKRLGFELGPDAAGRDVALTIMYFSPGLRWIPTYRLTLDGNAADASSATIDLQAELLNELENIRKTDLDLVVGVPNFRFKNIVSPLVLEAALRNALAAAAPQIMGTARDQFSNALFSQRAGEYAGRNERWDDQRESMAGITVPPELEGAGEQDLFVYTAPSFTLGRGDRATVPVWHQSVAVRHLYTFDVEVVRDPNGNQRLSWEEVYRLRHGNNPPPSTADGSPLKFLPDQVWHQLELENKSQTPWTTGPVLMLAQRKSPGDSPQAPGPLIPVSQELMTYTAIGAKALVPVTVAVDIRGQFSEQEIERVPDAIEWRGNRYPKVRARGSIELTNHRTAASSTRVRLSVGGKALNPSDAGKVRVSGFDSRDWNQYDWWYWINPHSDVEWEVELKPGEKKTLTVEYEYYVR